MLLRRMIEHVRTQNWLAIVLDFIIVVLGVTFALLAEQWISERQKRVNLQEVELNLKTELISNYFAANERLSLTNCRVEQLRDLGDRLLQPAGAWEPVQRSEEDLEARLAYASVLRSPNRVWGSTIWKDELGRGTFNTWSNDRRILVDSVFRLTDQANKLQNDILKGEARLKTLAQVTELSRSQRLRYFDIVAEIDQYGYALEIMSGQIVRAIEMYTFDFTEEERDQVLNWVEFSNQNGSKIYGECRKPISFQILEDVTPESDETSSLID